MGPGRYDMPREATDLVARRHVERRQMWVGLLLGAAMVAAPMMVSMVSWGPPEDRVGLVTAVGVTHSKYTGAQPLAVEVDGRQVYVPLLSTTGCHTGDRVTLIRWHTVFGGRYRAGAGVCRGEPGHRWQAPLAGAADRGDGAPRSDG